MISWRGRAMRACPGLNTAPHALGALIRSRHGLINVSCLCASRIARSTRASLPPLLRNHSSSVCRRFEWVIVRRFGLPQIIAHWVPIRKSLPDLPRGVSYFVTGPMATTSNAEEGTRLMVARLASLQRGSGAPDTNQPLPLSAMNIPYVFIALSITRTSAG